MRTGHAPDCVCSATCGIDEEETISVPADDGCPEPRTAAEIATERADAIDRARPVIEGVLERMREGGPKA